MEYKIRRHIDLMYIVLGKKTTKLPEVYLLRLLFTLPFSFMYVSILTTYMSEHHIYAWCPWNPEEGIRALGSDIIDDCL